MRIQRNHKARNGRRRRSVCVAGNQRREEEEERARDPSPSGARVADDTIGRCSALQSDVDDDGGRIQTSSETGATVLRLRREGSEEKEEGGGGSCPS